MSHTRNARDGFLAGPPCPSSRLMKKEATNATSGPGIPPSDEELARQLDAVFAEIAESEAASQKGYEPPAPSSPLSNTALRRYRLGGEKMQHGASPGWLKRAIRQDYPKQERKPGWRGYLNSAAPLIAVGVLLSLYPAFRYVLSGNESAETVQVQPVQQKSTETKKTAVGTASAAPVVRSQPVRVRTVRVVPVTAEPKEAPARAPAPEPRTPETPAPATANTVSPAPQGGETRAATPVASVSRTPERPSPVIAPKRENRLEQGERDVLMERAQKLTREGDIAGAKLAYQYLAQAGDAKAALALARLNDPEALAGMGVVGLSGDNEQALYWYNRAAKLGNLEAARQVARSSAR